MPHWGTAEKRTKLLLTTCQSQQHSNRQMQSSAEKMHGARRRVDLHPSGIGNVYLYMSVVSAMQVFLQEVCLMFCFVFHDSGTEYFVKKAGVRHLLHLTCVVALTCMGIVLPLATGMRLRGEENKQRCVLGTHTSCSNLVLMNTGHIQRVGEEGRRNDGGQFPPPILTLRINF